MATLLSKTTTTTTAVTADRNSPNQHRHSSAPGSSLSRKASTLVSINLDHVGLFSLRLSFSCARRLVRASSPGHLRPPRGHSSSCPMAQPNFKQTQPSSTSLGHRLRQRDGVLAIPRLTNSVRLSELVETGHRVLPATPGHSTNACQHALVNVSFSEPTPTDLVAHPPPISALTPLRQQGGNLLPACHFPTLPIPTTSSQRDLAYPCCADRYSPNYISRWQKGPVPD